MKLKINTNVVLSVLLVGAVVYLCYTVYDENNSNKQDEKDIVSNIKMKLKDLYTGPKGDAKEKLGNPDDVLAGDKPESYPEPLYENIDPSGLMDDNLKTMIKKE